MGMTRTGYWVEKTPDGKYVKRPVTFYFDDAGNLVGMRDPNGNTRGFVTQYSVSGNTQSYFANACDYFIATVPAEDWVWFTPNAVGFKDATGKLHMLYHDVNDVFKKRADVADYLKTYHPTCSQYYAQQFGLNPSSQRSTPTTQATALEQASKLPVASREYVPVGVAPQPLATTPATAGDLAKTGNLIMDQYARAMLAGAPPGFREIYNLMLQEGQRQELLLMQKLPPERYQYYQKLRAQAAIYSNQFTNSTVSFDVYKRLNQAIYQAMLKEAGLTEQDMLKSSPYLPQLTQAVSSVNPQMGQLLQYAWYEKPQQEEKRQVLIQAVVQKIQQLPLEKKAQLQAVLASALAKRTKT
jgi:hypothetical protein